MTVDFASDFADFGGAIYLNCAYQGPMPLVAAAAAMEALELKKTPNLVRDPDYFSYPDAYRAAVADLIDCPAADIAVTDSATHGVMILVNGLDWSAGDEVILPQGEFPANRFPWLSLARRGVKIREVPTGPGRSGLDRLEAAINPRTRVCAASWVAYSTGLRLDIEALSTLCRDRGILFVLDATQGIGGLDFRLPQIDCDLLVCAGYKWLLGPYGLGFAYVEPGLGERLTLGNVNWFAIEGARDFNRLSECELAFVPGAIRFDINETANFVNIAAGVESLRYLARVGVPTIERHVASLLDRLLDGLPDGFRDASPPGTRLRSNILCIAGPTDAATDRAAAALDAERVFVSRREGTLRFSPHLFNSPDEIDRVLAILERSVAPTSNAILKAPAETDSAAETTPGATDPGSAAVPRTGAPGTGSLPVAHPLPVGSRLADPSPRPRPGGETLAGRFVTLRPLDAANDAGQLYPASHGTPDREALWTYMAYGPFSSATEMRSWLERLEHSTDPLFYAVVATDSNRSVGMASLQRMAPEHGSIEVAHLWYVTEQQRTAVNTETVFLLLRKVFDTLGYRRVEWKCDALNRRSRRAAARLGFRFEGIFRQHMIVKGRSRDTAWFAMLDREWPTVRAHIERWLVSDGELSLTQLTQQRRLANAVAPA